MHGDTGTDEVLSPLVRGMRAPVLAELAPLVRKARQERRDLVDLGQAVPDFGPPRAALERVAAELHTLGTHQYTADEGRPTLRRQWARILGQRFGLTVDPERELLITAGANQAYVTALATLLGPGDRMGIPSPWYFNHPMAVEMLGGELVELPLRPDAGYSLDPDALIQEARRRRLKALTLVNPNNPSGVAYPPAVVRRLAEGLLEAGIFLVVDETYAFFADPAIGHFSPGSLEPRPNRVITLGSFSKTFGMTGWRIGYLVASEGIVRQALKVIDTTTICACHPGQLLAEACLDSWDWVEQRRREMAGRERVLREEAGAFGRWRVASAGPFFALVNGPAPGRALALDLLSRDGVVVTPAESFGSGMERTVRLALGSVQEPQLREGLRRMSRRFETYPA